MSKAEIPAVVKWMFENDVDPQVALEIEEEINNPEKAQLIRKLRGERQVRKVSKEKGRNHPNPKT